MNLEFVEVLKQSAMFMMVAPFIALWITAVAVAVLRVIVAK